MNKLSRRSFLRLSAGSIAAITLGGSLAACGQAGGGGSSRAIKIGYVSPQTGPLAGFGEADAFILNGMAAMISEKLGGRAVEIIVKDSQSDPNRASSEAANLILQDEIDLMVVASTPETTNPVSDQCEANGVPCISTKAPWQPWYFRNPNVPEAGYNWTYHFFWGLEDIIGVFTTMWSALDTNKVVGAMWPNDGDGLAWSDANLGFPPALAAAGFTLVDPGRYQNLTDDFSAQITAFKNAGVEIVTGVMIPPDLVTFMTQASQQDFRPKMVTVGKAALFPSAVDAIGGNLGDGLTTEVWWTPSHPFSSSLTGASAADLAAAYTTETGRPWSQPLGFIHALFEVAADALARAEDPTNKEGLRDAIKATNLNTIVGAVNWANGPTPNVTKTPLVGGQWARTANGFEMQVTTNATASNIPSTATLRPMPWSA
jgi:branched-chain amino acid transport system substrate-binding protein